MYQPWKALSALLLLFLPTTTNAFDIAGAFQKIGDGINFSISSCLLIRNNGWWPCADRSAKWGAHLYAEPGLLLCDATDFDTAWNWTTYRCAAPPAGHNDCVHGIYTNDSAIVALRGAVAGHDRNRTHCTYYSSNDYVNDWNAAPPGFCRNVNKLNYFEKGHDVIRYIRPLSARCELFAEEECTDGSSLMEIVNPGWRDGYGGYTSPEGWGIRSIRCQECSNCTSGKSAADVNLRNLASQMKQPLETSAAAGREVKGTVWSFAFVMGLMGVLICLSG